MGAAAGDKPIAHGTHRAAISRLEGSGRPNPGGTPQLTIMPPPEWVED